VVLAEDKPGKVVKVLTVLLLRSPLYAIPYLQISSLWMRVEVLAQLLNCWQHW
jgi:hypothetical protein